MSYRELIAELDREHAKALSDVLLDIGALSVSVEDTDADTPDEQPLFGEPGLVPEKSGWNRSRVVALLPEDADPAVLLTAASNEIGLTATSSFAVREVEKQDWVRLTQSQFDPISIGERIWVVPSWHDAPDPNAFVLELDPGLAFGTGSHPTTRLCMEWLEQHVKLGKSLLDYGCGSGILAILAKKCGAEPVHGIDIDSQAVESARQNSERNCAEVTYGLPDECLAGEFDIVVANILSNPLKLMASMLASKVKPGGRIALSGVLVRQAEKSRWRMRSGSTSASGASTKAGCALSELAAKAFRIAPSSNFGREAWHLSWRWQPAAHTAKPPSSWTRICSRRMMAACAAVTARKYSMPRITGSNWRRKKTCWTRSSTHPLSMTM